MTKETLGQLIIGSEETMYRIAKSLLYNDADCADAIQEAIVKAFAKLHTLKDDSYAKICPHCGSSATYLLEGNGFSIKEIEGA